MTLPSRTSTSVRFWGSETSAPSSVSDSVAVRISEASRVVSSWADCTSSMGLEMCTSPVLEPVAKE